MQDAQPSNDKSRDYETRERLGKGAFGTVYLAVHKDTNKRYVLKKVKLARQSKWQREASLQEMQMVSPAASFQPTNRWYQTQLTLKFLSDACPSSPIHHPLH